MEYHKVATTINLILRRKQLRLSKEVIAPKSHS